MNDLSSSATSDDPRAGHRQRLRERIYRGDDTLLDHELVEYLLTLTNRRQDTKLKAKELLARYGGIGRLLDTDAATLKRDGATDAQVGALRIAALTARRLLEAKIEETPVLSNYAALIDYLRAAMAHKPGEEVRVLYLNAKNRLIANERASEGSVDESAVYIREIIRRALELGASGLILVHNHPSGDPTPSKADIRLTRELVEAARHMKIALHDHVVIGLDGETSMRAQKLF